MRNDFNLSFLGSACLNLAFVAAGNCDVYCHAGIRCWDMAAGALIVQESGGIVLGNYTEYEVFWQ